MTGYDAARREGDTSVGPEEVVMQCESAIGCYRMYMKKLRLDMTPPGVNVMTEAVTGYDAARREGDNGVG